MIKAFALVLVGLVCAILSGHSSGAIVYGLAAASGLCANVGVNLAYKAGQRKWEES